MNCAKRSCFAQAACALPCAWPLPELNSVEGIMIRRIVLLMVLTSTELSGWSNVRSAELFGVAQPVARCGEVGG